MTIQIFIREFFTAVRKILSLYIQESTGSPERFSLSQWINFSCIKRKRFPYSNQRLTEPDPLRTLSKIPEGDSGLTAHFLVHKLIYYSILNVRYWDNDSRIAQETNLPEKPLSTLWLVRQLINIFWNGALVHHCQNSIYDLFFWGKEVEWWKPNCHCQLGKTI